MAKNSDILSRWVDEYTADLYSWAVFKISDRETAKDLVQDTFLVAAEKMDSFKGDSSPRTWLFSILNHKIIDTYRKKDKQPVTTGSHILSELFDKDGSWKKEKRPQHWHEDEKHLLHNEDFLAVLAACLDALPDTWNTCVKLKYLSGKKGEEICQAVGLTASNYWQIIHRAKLQLRECIEDNWFNE